LECQPSWEFLFKENVDRYVCIWDITAPRVNAPGVGACYKSQNFDCFPVNEQAVKRAFKTERLKILPTENFYKPEYEEHNCTNFGRFEDYKSMHFCMKECFEMLNEEYDVVIRCRPDLYFTRQPSFFVTEKLHFPLFSYRIPRLYSDMFFWGSQSAMKKAMEFTKEMDKYVGNRFVESFHERFFTAYMQEKEIAISDDLVPRMQICRTDKRSYTVSYMNENGVIETPHVPGHDYLPGSAALEMLNSYINEKSRYSYIPV
jgi:hypothetical protein